MLFSDFIFNVFGCDVWCLKQSVYSSSIIFNDLSLEKTDKFDDTIRSTQKTGFLSK